MSEDIRVSHTLYTTELPGPSLKKLFIGAEPEDPEFGSVYMIFCLVLRRDGRKFGFALVLQMMTL